LVINLQPIYNSSRTRIPAEPTFYYYDVSDENSRQITLSESQKYNIDPSSKSPDGFTVGRADSGSVSFFPFYSTSRVRGTFYKGKGLNKQISEEYNFRFVGWVTNE